jgi:uncharacterized damage-inducible protein DinB
MLKLIPLALLLAASTAGGQATAASASAPVGAVAEAGALWKTSSSYLLRAAERAPDSAFAFRPVSTVRTFGQLIGHVAGSQRMFCAMALGEAPAAEDVIEKSATTKAALVAALRESNAYCARAYAMSDADASANIDVFGARRTKRFALMMNATHDDEHYGNVVTYMRILGMVPPSSQPSP